jgi:hypothetical protein
MPREGFKPTTPVFERAKTVHALERAATVMGSLVHIAKINYRNVNMLRSVVSKIVFLGKCMGISCYVL